MAPAGAAAVTVRQLSLEDTAAAAEALQELGEVEASPASIRTFLERPGHYLLVAYFTGAPAGWLLA